MWKNSVAAAFLFASFAQAQGPGISPKWKACAVDSDCIAGVIGCWAWVPINKKYVDMEPVKHEQRYVKDANISCLSSTMLGSEPTVICRKKTCRMK